MSTWLITGCSSGLGKALANAVLAIGHNAVVTARDVTAVQDLVSRYPESAFGVALDVTNHADIADVVKQAESRFGGVDVVVNNAGYGYRAAVEEGNDEDIQRLFDTNVFGPIAIIKSVLPGMRARRSGAIVNISSIATRICPPGSGYYSASKAALNGISGSLYQEVAPLGISVTVVEPGAFRTEFAGRSLTQSASAISDYADTAGKRRKENDTMHGTQQGDPEKAAQAIISAVDAPDTPFLLLLGSDAMYAYRVVEETRRAEVDRWQQLSMSTDFAPST